jgi:beta-galactosidase
VKKKIPAYLFAVALLASLGRGAELSASAASPRRTVDLDFGWRFAVSDSAMAMQAKFDDSAWRQVNVPHDWSIEGPFSAANASGNGYAPGGIGWYRRHFRIEAADQGKLVRLELDGVYDNAEVWLNGFFVGRRPSGYESFACDLTPLLKFGAEDNVLAVRVDHSRFADSRWYTGSGIYRHVRLVMTDPLHLVPGGTYVTTPNVQEGSAMVRIETAVENSAGQSRHFVLQSDLIGPDGQVAASGTATGSLTAGQNQIWRQELTLVRPQLWSPDSPALYILRTRLDAAGAAVDQTDTPFGVRRLEFDPDQGFSLNGVPMKFKGVCVHQDGGSVGVAVPIQIWERRLRALQQLGVNAIRSSHNPPAPEFLDLCDRMGFLVMDEAFDEFTPAKNKWVVGWNQGVPGRFGYSEFFADWSVRDIQDMVRRDRNHPSIVLWSIGNEIDYPNDPFTDPALGKAYRPGNPPGTDMVKWGRPLVAAVKQLDPTRPVTAALASVAMSNAVGFAQILDVTGYNYQEARYGADHQQFPRRFIYGSENYHTYAAWAAVRDNPLVGGQFLWTGVDYLGEARAWPARASADGLLDLCGFVKPLGRFRQSLWSGQPMVYVCAAPSNSKATDDIKTSPAKESWNWPAQTLLTVSCYTNCPEVTLMLNGQPIGIQRAEQAVDGVLHWQVPYAPGTLKAVGRKDGRDVCEFALQSAGVPSRIELHPDVTQLQADGKEVCQVEFDVVDADGVRVPDATEELTFALSGPAHLLGLGNGDIANREPVKGPAHQAYQGRGLAIIQSSPTPGAVTLTVSSPNLPSATLRLDCR